MYSRMGFNLPHTLELELLSSGCVGLVHLVLDLSHAFGFFDSELFAFLVPSPFVNLPFTQASLLAQR